MNLTKIPKGLELEGTVHIRLNMHRRTRGQKFQKLVSVFLSLSNVEWLYVLGARGKMSQHKLDSGPICNF